MGFLTLDNFLLPAPLPAIVSLLMVFGVAGTARRLADAPRRPAAFVTILALCGALVHFLLLAHMANLLVLRLVAALLISAGLYTLPASFRSTVGYLRTFRGGSLAERGVLALVACSVAAMILTALSPVTDADSLDYHLGVPLGWLRHGGVGLQPHWLHQRLTGLGEALNTLGLAAGTDCFGAVLQVSGLIVVMLVVVQTGLTLRDRIFGLLLVLSPAVLPLISSQKPQLLPVAALVAALSLARTANSGHEFALVFSCIAFAMACKYSFAVSGAVVVAVALAQAQRSGILARAVACAAGAFTVLFVPVLGRNLFLYADPFSPFLETFREHPDPELVQFASYLRDVGGEHTLAGILAFLRHLLWPAGAGDIQTVLGLGIVALLLASTERDGWLPLTGFGIVLGFTLWRGQMASRYLLEAYFWCVAAAVAAPWSRLKRFLFYGMSVQTAGVAVVAIFLAAMLFPGALTPHLRDRVMTQSTFGYAEARWLDRVVPKDAAIVAPSRAYALLPRPFQIPACSSCGSVPEPDIAASTSLPADVTKILVLPFPGNQTVSSRCTGSVLAGPQRLPWVTRNPFNRSDYDAVALLVACPE